MLQTLARPIVAKPSGLVADPVDVALGARIRVARKLSGSLRRSLPPRSASRSSSCRNTKRA
ncbi:hypothetical protein [Chenggangzhangella methanolivorans]|uniref:hypothetical protein n=1 Tax=Chenggangzhangella methanolivorans TaxID=1437009 RepID=UPI0021BDD8AA|nr:hypothetical protein [Chenggangzhangella methanolivorans]